MASPGGSKVFEWDLTVLNHTSYHSYSRGLFLLLIFFSLVIFITTLFLYAHWICSQRRPSTAAAQNATPAPSPGLDPDFINSLPIVWHRSVVPNSKGKNGFIEETECSICLGLFEDEEKLKVLPECNHAYHSECVDKWLSSQSSCPLCRASLSPITP
ncbi:PREDICTED: RING-H2 finger protein ATL66 [Theobroma cacao]|uniref:RING-type E3 ubiquitin transferase n=1 Tax=Theobroma cacao TaxID=3641 RepID=A0AB32WVP2_THECC|nr:PREDICTED: RING-H2 finger protein ATL66 [Theobroma cacao]